ncbi:zinc finger CCCH domain-containing protein 14-like protein [Tanacetum coccineum]|uniref:Zinc finger CCCH domain-containing protein 14-like protein n=1 Tax=Tanacetum coccineum TaxID=301880 RepID=A0ABQ5AP27_9ASTR
MLTSSFSITLQINKLSAMSTEKKEISSSEIITGGVNSDVDNDNNLIGDIFLSDEFDYSCGGLFNPNNTNSNNNSSIFPPKFISQSQLSYSSPSDCSFDDDALFSANAIATENCLSQASFILDYQQLYNCYTMCLTTLQDSVKEVEALRDENESLRVANAELLNRLSLFSNSTRMMSSFVPNVRSSSASLTGEFIRLGIGSAFCESNNNGEEFPSVSPTSVIEPNQFVRGDQRVPSMPKSISVRSKGYLKSVATTQRPIRQQNTNQRVRVAGEKKAGEGMEFEVYNQGMSKTELCNKWQETGACPYGDNCHFAHGISELRPVIRHPRYKTEVCRMVLAGDICPYGHRCHFRHSLTNEELLMGVNRS